MAYGDFYPDFYSPDDFSGGGGYDPLSHVRPQAPKRLTYEELLALMQQTQAPPPRPAMVASARELTGDDRRQAQQAGLWQGLAALGAGMSGRPDPDAVARVQAAQQGVVDQYNARQQAGYRDSVETHAAEIAQEQEKQKAGALFGSYEKIAEAEPPDSQFAQDAAAAAKLGDMSKLQTMLTQVPQRAAARAKGLDPDAWETNQRLQEQLKQELEIQRRNAIDPLEQKKAAELAAIQAAKEKEVKLAPGWQAPPQYEPLSRVFAREEGVQAIRDRHEASRTGAPGLKGRLGQAPDSTWGWISPPDATHPGGNFTPIEGQPTAKGKSHFFTIDGQPYRIDIANPDMAIPIPLKKGEKKGAAPPPAPPANPSAVDEEVGKQVRGWLDSPGVKLAGAGQKNPAVAQKIADARAHGYSDSEIAAFLGIH